MQRTLLLVGALAGFWGVVAGTFGAHALDPNLPPRMHDVFESAVRYQMVHALAILITAWGGGHGVGRFLALSGCFFTAGIIFFSGSLYLLVLTGARWLGMVAPVGGTAFLVGWALLFVAALRGRSPVRGST